MYTFKQSTGELFKVGMTTGRGAAGQGAGLNNPAKQDVHKIGPLPRGRYKIGAPYHHPHLGPLTFNLTPDPANKMFGRDEFKIHGFEAGCDHTNPRTSSEGCIAQEHPTRQYVADNLSSDDDLEVVE